MSTPAAPGHPGYWRDVRRIWDITEVTPGLPVPAISSTRAVFDYRRITHAADAAERVALAETILSYALNLTFARREALAGDDTLRYILEAFMPSGLAVDIVARAEHMQHEPAPVSREDAPELAAVAA